MGIGDGEGAALEADDEAAPFVTQLRILHRGAQKRRMLVDGDSQRQELLLRLLHMAGEHELAQALRRLQLLHAKLALLYSAVENLQLCSGADDQQRVVAGDNLLCARHVDRAVRIGKLQHVAAIILTEVKRFEALACDWRVFLYHVISKLQILVEPLAVAVAGGFAVLAHMLFVKIDEEARFDAQVLAHEPVGGGNHVADDEHAKAGQQTMQAEDSIEDEINRSGGDEHFAKEQNQQRQMVGTLFEPQLGEQIGVAGAVDEHGTQNRRHDDERESCCDDVGIWKLQRICQIGLQIHAGADGNRQEQRAENHHTHHINIEQVLPILVLAGAFVVVRIAVEPAYDTLWQDADQLVIGRIGSSDAEWRGEGGDNRNGNDNRIEEAADNAKAHAQGGDDEGKFTNLRQAEAAVNRGRQAFAGGQHAERGENKLADDGRYDEHEDRQCLLQQQRRIYQHAYGHEEDSAEKVFDGRDKMLNFFGVGRFGNQRAHDEGAERGGEAEVRCQHDHAEAQTDSDDDERFVIHQALRPLEEAGDEVHAEHEPEHEEERQTANAEQQLDRGHVRRCHR